MRSHGQADLNSFPLENWRRPPGRPRTVWIEEYPAGPEINEPVPSRGRLLWTLTFKQQYITVRTFNLSGFALWFVLLKGCFVAGNEILELVSGGVIGLGLAVGLILVSKLNSCRVTTCWKTLTGNVRKFDSCHREKSGNLVKVWEKILSGKMCPRVWMVYNFIVGNFPFCRISFYVDLDVDDSVLELLSIHFGTCQHLLYNCCK